MHYRSCTRLIFATLMLLILRIYLFRGAAESSTVQGVRSRRNKSFRVGNLQQRTKTCQPVPRLVWSALIPMPCFFDLFSQSGKSRIFAESARQHDANCQHFE